AHEYDADLPPLGGIAPVAGHRDASACDRRGHELHHALLDHRRMPGRDQVELGLIDVHADDAMAVAGEAGERDGAHVAETEDADVHACIGSRSWIVIARSRKDSAR